ncbi:flavoprotein, partial [Mesorhizobium sp. M0293]
PEPGFIIVGSKSYGRAPTFLMATGYEQVRSVVADIAGDHLAAREVRLVLPETGVCSAVGVVTGSESAGCCGGPAPANVDACCVRDADAKAKGASGCGCGTDAEARRAVSAGVDA